MCGKPLPWHPRCQALGRPPTEVRFSRGAALGNPCPPWKLQPREVPVHDTPCQVVRSRAKPHGASDPIRICHFPQGSGPGKALHPATQLQASHPKSACTPPMRTHTYTHAYIRTAPTHHRGFKITFSVLQLALAHHEANVAFKPPHPPRFLLVETEAKVKVKPWGSGRTTTLQQGERAIEGGARARRWDLFQRWQCDGSEAAMRTCMAREEHKTACAACKRAHTAHPMRAAAGVATRPKNTQAVKRELSG